VIQGKMRPRTRRMRTRSRLMSSQSIRITSSRSKDRIRDAERYKSFPTAFPRSATSKSSHHVPRRALHKIKHTRSSSARVHVRRRANPRRASVGSWTRRFLYRVEHSSFAILVKFPRDSLVGNQVKVCCDICCHAC
jgi:hypothetical protein